MCLSLIFSLAPPDLTPPLLKKKKKSCPSISTQHKLSPPTQFSDMSQLLFQNAYDLPRTTFKNANPPASIVIQHTCIHTRKTGKKKKGVFHPSLTMKLGMAQEWQRIILLQSEDSLTPDWLSCHVSETLKREREK